jgi:malic enzyme
MIVIHRNLWTLQLDIGYAPKYPKGEQQKYPIHNNQSSSGNFHDDQDETDVIALVALFNALRLLHKKLSKVDVAI